ncbi:hypothetical protein [Bradyrhizobium sp. 2S1]|uniref:hypothetical protein n=1 Tax=Bradyrhizobium sp. 2S1 TaxID=1404429 RepID=UPI00140B9854|nr:hypothetical protein [Bradyrhizobium sp. 2S1]MCK7669191.1 hypothetical protein [Bradyrhizobium sp. 2S1]
MDSWEFTKRTGTILSLASVVTAFAWFCFSTVSRISTLEAQMQALTISVPAQQAAPSTPAVPPQPGSPKSTTQPLGETVRVNPIAQVCADLALQLADKHKGSNAIGALDPIATTMDHLNCKGQR